MAFTNFDTGNSHSFGGEDLELVPHQRIRCSCTFDKLNLPIVIQVMVSLIKELCGTKLSIVQAVIPEVIPVEACQLGWQNLLMQLAALVEPEILG